MNLQQLQHEYNRRQHYMLEAMYGNYDKTAVLMSGNREDILAKRKEMGWTISEQDVEKHRREAAYSKLLTYPTPDYYTLMFGKTPKPKLKEVTFRKYAGNIPDDVKFNFRSTQYPEECQPVQIPEQIQKYYEHKLGIKTMEEPLYNMDAKARMDLMKDYFNQKREKKNMDVSEEMKDLLKVYAKAHEELENQAAGTLHNLIYDMKRFIGIYDEKEKVESKLKSLKNKLGIEDEEEDEGDDE